MQKNKRCQSQSNISRCTINEVNHTYRTIPLLSLSIKFPQKTWRKQLSRSLVSTSNLKIIRNCLDTGIHLTLALDTCRRLCAGHCILLAHLTDPTCKKLSTSQGTRSIMTDQLRKSKSSCFWQGSKQQL